MENLIPKAFPDSDVEEEALAFCQTPDKIGRGKTGFVGLGKDRTPLNEEPDDCKICVHLVSKI